MGASEIRRLSANNSVNDSINSGETIAPCFPSIISRASSLVKSENSTGLHTSPCFTPRSHSIKSENLFSFVRRAKPLCVCVCVCVCVRERSVIVSLFILIYFI